MKRTLGLVFILLILASPFASGAAVHPLLRSIIEGEPGASIPLPAALRSPGGPESLSDHDRLGVWILTSDGGSSLETAGLLRPGEGISLGAARLPGFNGGVSTPSGGAMMIRRARWTRREMLAASLDPTVVYMRPAIRCKPYLDVSLVDTETAATHDGAGIPPVYAGLTGARVVVGVVDTGIDLEHGDFQDIAGNTRILAVWDQTSTADDHPVGFDYGKEWTADQIDDGLADEIDEDGHGTHVAGIAAGDGSATGHSQPPYRYVGMAPDATIVFVKTDFWDSSLVDGVQYIMAKADSVGFPVVVNLSLNHFA